MDWKTWRKFECNNYKEDNLNLEDAFDYDKWYPEGLIVTSIWNDDILSKDTWRNKEQLWREYLYYCLGPKVERYLDEIGVRFLKG